MPKPLPSHLYILKVIERLPFVHLFASFIVLLDFLERYKSSNFECLLGAQNESKWPTFIPFLIFKIWSFYIFQTRKYNLSRIFMHDKMSTFYTFSFSFSLPFVYILFCQNLDFYTFFIIWNVNILYDTWNSISHFFTMDDSTLFKQ